MMALKPLGDPQADRVVADLLDTGQIGSVNALFSTIHTVDQDQGLPATAPPLLRDYLKDTGRFPEWTDWERVGHIGRFYAQHKRTVGAVQGTAGLIGTYLSPVGAKTLHATHSLDHPARRLAQSTRLFIGMGDQDAFARNSTLIPTCQKVRLVHAAVRQLLARSGTWDVSNDGEPVSQLYAYEAMLVFSIGTLDAMKRLGVEVTDEQEDGFYYAWKLMAYWLGIPESPAPLPDTVEAARVLWHEARDGGTWGPSQDGVVLTAGCIELYESRIPAGLKGFVPAFVRQVLTDRYADMVGVPHSHFERELRAASGFLERLTAIKDRFTARHEHSAHGTHHGIDALGEAVEQVSKKLTAAPGHADAPKGAEPQMPDHIE
jgi:hypothetical protein